MSVNINNYANQKPFASYVIIGTQAIVVMNTNFNLSSLGASIIVALPRG